MKVRMSFPNLFAVAALLVTLGTSAGAANVTAKPGLAPQFATWPVPLYTSHVVRTETWAPNSYEIDTSDSREKVIAWYRSRLGKRAMATNGRIAQLAVDLGNYIVNFAASPSGSTSINVIKN